MSARAAGLLAMALLLLPAGGAAAAGSGSYPPPTGGDWTVTNDTWVANETIFLDGNLTVSGANLTLENVTVDFNLTGEHLLAAVVENATITAKNCTFLVGMDSDLTFDLAGPSRFSGCSFIIGGGWIGVYFRGPDSFLRNSIAECSVYLEATPAPDLTGTSFQNASAILSCYRDMMISNVSFHDCSEGATCGTNVTFSDCTFQDCVEGLVVGSMVRASNCIFQNCSTGIVGGVHAYSRDDSISNGTFENCSTGILTGERTNISGCFFQTCLCGIDIYNSASIRDCNFGECNTSVLAEGTSDINGCSFGGDNGTGVQWSVPDLNVTGCTFEFPDGKCIDGAGWNLNLSRTIFNDSAQALNLTVVSSGSIQDCTFEMSEGLDGGALPSVELAGDFVLRDSLFTGGNGTLLSIRAGDSRAINVTFPSDRTEVKTGASLEVEWYLDSTVLYQNGTPAANATVRAEDRFGNSLEESPTGPDGRAPRFEAPEYLREFDGTTRYTPYWLNASKGGLSRAVSVNVNQNLDLTLVLADVTPPRIQILSPGNGTLTNRSTVQLSGTAGDDIGVASVQVRADGGAWAAADGTTNWTATLNLSDGDHLIEARAIDDAGNAAQSSMRISVDTLPPFLDVTYPAQELLVNTTSIEVTGRTEPGSIVRADGEPVPFYLGQFLAEVELQEGINEITVTARDAAGNVNSSLVKVTRDTIPPDLTVAVPRDGEVTGQRILAVSGTVEEGARVLVDDLDATVSGPFFSANVTLVDGENLITVQARDPAGNLASVALIVTLDTAPQSISVDLENGTITRSSELLLTGETKNGSALSVNGVAADVGPDGHFRMNISLRLGLNSIHLEARDPLGNTASLDRTVIREEPLQQPKPAGQPPAQNGNTPTILVAVALVITIVIALALIFRRPPEPVPGTASPDGPAQKGSGE